MENARLLDGHAGSAVKVLVATHYSVLVVRNGTQEMQWDKG